MPKYGIIKKNGDLQSSESMLPGYKEIVFQEIPKDFNQETHYITQQEPEDREDHIFLGVNIYELDLTEEDFGEEFLDEVKG